MDGFWIKSNTEKWVILKKDKIKENMSIEDEKEGNSLLHSSTFIKMYSQKAFSLGNVHLMKHDKSYSE